MKELLLAKSNIRKGKGIAIGLTLLIMLTACFLNIVLIIFNDFNTNVSENAKKLNSEDASIFLSGDISNITEEYIKENIDYEKVDDYEIEKMLAFSISTPYSDGFVDAEALFNAKEKVLNSRIGKTEIVEEDASIEKDYIYLPYQYKTGGKQKIGEEYEIKISNKTYKFKIKGFANNMALGSYAGTLVQFIVDENTYNELQNSYGNVAESMYVKFDLKEEINKEKFINSFSNHISKQNKSTAVYVRTIDNYTYIRTYFASILGIAFLTVSLIILIVVFLMTSNSISNYIKENIRILGVIKANGYTSKNIRDSFLVQFLSISIVGSILGVALSYLIIPFVSGIMNRQVGVPYSSTFNVMCSTITLISTILLVIITVSILVRKTNKIQPLVALRDGVQTHSFKKNIIKLEKTKLKINAALAYKTTLTNIKQNITTFIVTVFLVFSGVLALTVFENISLNTKVSLFSFETADAIVIPNMNNEKEVLEQLQSNEKIKNIRLVAEHTLDIEDAKMYTFIIDDSNSLNNKDVYYKGRLPEYENEVAISGKFAEEYKYKIGDEIEIKNGEIKEKYIITGFIQTFNNLGKELVMLENGAEKLLGNNYEKKYYFDLEENQNMEDVSNEIRNNLGDKIIEIIDFKELTKGGLSSFTSLADILVIGILSIDSLIVLLVLYLLIKTLINNKKKDYGILKAIGYTSSDIIKQNAISFMPSIVLAVIFSSIISCFIANPFLLIIMKNFGIMKVTFEIPLTLVAIMGIGFIIISFIFAVLLSLKIKKIEAYNLLRGE